MSNNIVFYDVLRKFQNPSRYMFLLIIRYYELLYCNYKCCNACRGAALPTNTPGIPCIFDPHGRAGICGDWLLGSSLESAALSGMALANHVSVVTVFFNLKTIAS